MSNRDDRIVVVGMHHEDFDYILAKFELLRSDKHLSNICFQRL